jgi:hypothetical protein
VCKRGSAIIFVLIIMSMLLSYATQTVLQNYYMNLVSVKRQRYLQRQKATEALMAYVIHQCIKKKDLLFGQLEKPGTYSAVYQAWPCGGDSTVDGIVELAIYDGRCTIRCATGCSIPPKCTILCDLMHIDGGVAVRRWHYEVA